MTNNMEMAEILNNFFASVFNGTLSFHISQVPECQGMNWRNEIREDQVQDDLSLLKIHKSVGPNKILCRALRKLANVIVKPNI